MSRVDRVFYTPVPGASPRPDGSVPVALLQEEEREESNERTTR